MASSGRGLDLEPGNPMEGTRKEGSNPDPLRRHEEPACVILYGGGLEKWPQKWTEYIVGSNPSIEAECLSTRMKEAIEKDGRFFAEQPGEDGLSIIVSAHPERGYTRREAPDWCEWGAKMVEECNMIKIISTSTDLDSIVKMLTNESGIQSELATPLPGEVQAVPRYYECLQHLTRMRSILEKKTNQPVFSSEEEEEVPNEEEGLGTSRDTEEVWEAKDTRRGGAFAPKLNPLIRKDPLPSLPEESTKKVIVGNGVLMCQFVGDIWSLTGDALIVFTNDKFRAWNQTFDSRLRLMAGEKYIEDLQDARRQMEHDPEDLTFIFTSGGRSKYHMIIHAVVQKWSADLDQQDYLKMMTKILEKAVDAAIERGARRIVTEVNGVRSGRMSWKIAETAIAGAYKLQIATPITAVEGLEFVLAISASQRRERELVALEATYDQALLVARKEQKMEQQTQQKVTVLPHPSVRVIRTEEEKGAASSFTPVLQVRTVRSRTPSPTAGDEDETVANKINPEITRPGGPDPAPTEVPAPEKPPQERGRRMAREKRVVLKSNRKVAGTSYRARLTSTPKNRPSTVQGPRQQIGSRNTEVGATEHAHTSNEEEGDNDGEGEGREAATSSDDVVSEEEDQASVMSAVGPPDPNDPPPRVVLGATRKGAKKQQPVLSIFQASERLAREVQLGWVETKDGRKTYIPEVKQKEYPFPPAWWEKIERNLDVPVKLTYREAMNVLNTPAYHTLVSYTDLTKNFREGFVTVMYDVLLRRMKQGVYDAAQAELRACEDLDTHTVNPAMSTQTNTIGNFTQQAQPSTTQLGVTYLENTGMPGNDLERETRAFKTLKGMVRVKYQKESVKEYLLATWPVIKDGPGGELSKKLWLQYITAEPIGRDETAQEAYQRWVDDEEDDEDAHITRAKEALKQGLTLLNVWHKLKQVISPNRYVRVLRAVTEDKDTTFVKLGAEATLARIEESIKKWDRVTKHYMERQKPNPSGSTRTRTEDTQAGRKPPPRPTYGKGQKFNDNQRQNTQNNPKPLYGKVNSTGYVAKDVYDKMSPEERKALAEARKAAAPAGPRK